MDLDREQDLEQLRRIARTQQIQIEQLLKVLASQSRRLDELTGGDGELQQALALLEKLQREKQDAPDRETQQGSPQSPDGGKTESKPSRPRSGHGPTSQPKLPTEDWTYGLDDADKTCPSCGGELEPMAGQFDVSEMVDVVEVSYRLVRVKQQKYACRCGGCVETAPGPDRAVAGGRYSVPFAIKVITDKFLDHVPLARQQRILARHGVEVQRQTLWELTEALARRLQPAYDALFEHLLQQDVIGLDQTSWKRLERKNVKAWQMWCLTTADTVYHRICDDKGAATFVSLVGDYQGTIICDALSTHGAGARDSPHITLAGCWAHVFRRFEEAASDHDEAKHALDWIGKLFEIERKAGDDRERKAELRKTESAAVLDELKQWLWKQAPLKTLSLGAAARYTLANWERLTVFVNNPDVPLDNNQTERGIRGPVVGRKNHYGSKSRRGTEVAAIFYTLIETAKLNGLDPSQYLLDASHAAARGELLLPLPS